jgi:hypothetical protein
VFSLHFFLVFLTAPSPQQAFGAAAAPFSAAGRNARMGAKPPPPEPILDEDFDAFGNEEIDNFMKVFQRA